MSELYRKMQPFLGDEETLMQRMAGRMDLWEECVSLFPGKEILLEADAALHKGDDAELYGIVHRLKGNLSNFGFDRAAKKTMAVLQAIKEKDCIETKRCYAELREEYLQIAERLEDAR